MSAVPTTFWDDLAEDLKDPAFLLAYLTEMGEIEARRVLGTGGEEGNE